MAWRVWHSIFCSAHLYQRHSNTPRRIGLRPPQGLRPCCIFSASPISFRSPGTPRFRPASRACAISSPTRPSARLASSARRTSAKANDRGGSPFELSTRSLLHRPLRGGFFMSGIGPEMRRPHQPREEGCGRQKTPGHFGKTHRRFAQSPGRTNLIRTGGSPPPREEQLAGHRYRMVIEDLTKDEFRTFL